MGELRPIPGEVFQRQTIRYNPNPSMPLPEIPTQQVARKGPFGLFENPIEAESKKRQEENLALAKELDHSGKLQLCLEVNGIHNIQKATKKVEELVWSEEPESFTGQYLVHLLQDMAQRSRFGHDARVNTFVGQSLNNAQRRR